MCVHVVEFSLSLLVTHIAPGTTNLCPFPFFLSFLSNYITETIVMSKI